MKAVLFLPVCLLAATSIRLDVTDTRGRKVSGTSVEAGDPQPNDWRLLRLVKAKPAMQILWPYDSLVKDADGPGAIPVIVGDPAALAHDPHVAAGRLLRGEPCSADPAADSFSKGVSLLCAGKPADAVDALSLALKERERQLTRVPSEIFAAAMLSGKALLGAGQFDAAAVAFRKALRQRPGDDMATRLRAEALTGAGKPEAVP